MNRRYLTSEEAVGWVNENAKTILGHIRKYLPFAPYDQEDYLQDAYEAALAAVQIARDRQVPFVACFWVVFRRRITEVTPHPESKHHGGSQSPPTTICDSDADSYWDFVDRQDGSSLQLDIDRLYLLVRDHLTEAEKRVLSRALGIYGGRQGIKEIARSLGCSPANVRQLLNRAYHRLSCLVANRQLEIRQGDIDVRRLAVIAGLPKSMHKPASKSKDGDLHECQIA